MSQYPVKATWFWRQEYASVAAIFRITATIRANVNIQEYVTSKISDVFRFLSASRRDYRETVFLILKKNVDNQIYFRDYIIFRFRDASCHLKNVDIKAACSERIKHSGWIRTRARREESEGKHDVTLLSGRDTLGKRAHKNILAKVIWQSNFDLLMMNSLTKARLSSTHEKQRWS